MEIANTKEMLYGVMRTPVEIDHVFIGTQQGIPTRLLDRFIRIISHTVYYDTFSYIDRFVRDLNEAVKHSPVLYIIIDDVAATITSSPSRISTPVPHTYKKFYKLVHSSNNAYLYKMGA